VQSPGSDKKDIRDDIYANAIREGRPAVGGGPFWGDKYARRPPCCW